MIGDESWFHHFNSEIKQGMEWHHMISTKNGKFMGTVFWDTKGCRLVDFMLKRNHQSCSLCSGAENNMMWTL
jgi:hypothetical protein